jgi:prophage regulatory protein
VTLDRYLRLPEVLHVTGLGRTTIWERERAGTFPLRTRLGGKAVGWRESAILAWMDAPAGDTPEPQRRRQSVSPSLDQMREAHDRAD